MNVDTCILAAGPLRTGSRVVALLAMALGVGAAWAAPGDIDTTFGDNGKVLAGRSLVAMSDDRVAIVRNVVVGAAAGELEIQVLDAQGQPDGSFGSAGTARIPLPGYASFGFHAVRMPDDGLVVSGDLRDSFDPSVEPTPALLRLDSTGHAVSTFGPEGNGIAVLVDAPDTLRLAALPNGGVLVLQTKLTCMRDIGGTTECVGPLSVQRLLADGSVDSDFGTGGRAEVPGLYAEGGRPPIFAPRADGSIVVGDERGTLGVLTADGQVDHTFGNRGLLSAADYGVEGAVLPDGGVLLASLTPGSDRTLLIRLMPDGALDPTFGVEGNGTLALALHSAVTVEPMSFEYPEGMILAPDGKHAYLALRVWRSDFVCVAVARLSLASLGSQTSVSSDDIDCVTRVPAGLDTLAVTTSGHPLLALWDDTIGFVYRLRLDDAPAQGAIGLQPLTVSTLADEVTFTVGRSGGKDGPVSVEYSTVGSTASPGRDFIAAAGRLDWADGDTADRTVTVTILAHTGTRFVMQLSSPGGGAALLLGAVQQVEIGDATPTATLTPSGSGPVTGGGGALGVLELLGLFALTGATLRRKASFPSPSCCGLIGRAERGDTGAVG